MRLKEKNIVKSFFFRNNDSLIAERKLRIWSKRNRGALNRKMELVITVLRKSFGICICAFHTQCGRISIVVVF